MFDYLRRTGLILLIMAVVILSVAYVRNLRGPVVKLVPVQDPNYVQNPYEAQERLRAQGLYDGRIDGIWGKKTDKAYCDWCAIRAIEGK